MDVCRGGRGAAVPGPVHCIRELYRMHGIRVLYSGFPLAVLEMAGRVFVQLARAHGFFYQELRSQLAYTDILSKAMASSPPRTFPGEVQPAI